MNRSTDNTTLLSCNLAFLPINTSKISFDYRTILTVRHAVNALTCPFIIVLNILVMVAVKTKRQLRTKSNVALACLATTDLMVGLVVQPLEIAIFTLILKGKTDIFCSLKEFPLLITRTCVLASFNHVFLVSAERFLAIKHPFAYETLVTESRIIIASCLAWSSANLVHVEKLSNTDIHLVTEISVSVLVILLLIVIIYFNVVVYIEVCRSDKKIAANQVSLEAKQKILKNKKAFYTTIIVLLVIFFCYVPVRLCAVIIFSFKDRISSNTKNILYTFFSLITLLPMLNSLFNPLIYAVRIRYLRVALIQLLQRKTITQAEMLEMKIFGPRQIGVIANVGQGQNRAGQEEDEQQENETLNNGHEIILGTQRQEENEETPL